MSTERDCAALWNAAVRSDRGQRWQAAVDLAFWEKKAQQYDSGQVAVPNTMQAIARRLRPQMTLLDVGAGTGRFAFPLAEHVHSVTALDHSPAMLKVLQAKLRANDRIEVVCGSLEHTPLVRHDVVLAAWALYRCADLNAGLTRLLQLSGHELLIVDDDGVGSPHRRLRKKGQVTIMHKAKTLTGALLHLGVEIEVQEVQEEGYLRFADRTHCLSQLGMGHAAFTEQESFLESLEPYLEDAEGELIYRWPFTVSLLVVKRTDEQC